MVPRILPPITTLLITGSLSVLQADQETLSPRIANYDLSARLNVETKELEGRGKIRWTNPSDGWITDLYLHLYLNAFRGPETTFMRESGGRMRGVEKEDGGGGIELETLRWQDWDLLASAEFVQPEDGNLADSTLLRVELPRPIRPGEAIELEVAFRDRLPRVFARTGYAGSFFLVGQWFPKIAALTPEGWNAHQFHANSEFFADFGVYDVRITVPREYVVGATGQEVTESEEEGWRTVRYLAEDVHDFAWVASPDLRVAVDSVGSTEVKLYYPPGHRRFAPRHLQTITRGLELLQEWYGRYPYPTLTVVDTPAEAAGAGGMEYPTFSTTTTDPWLPQRVRFSEWTSLHELAHQYWHGMVATNEFEEPWLDEGLTSYTTLKLMEALFGQANVWDFLGLRVGLATLERASFLASPARYPVVQEAWGFPSGGPDYASTVYSRPVLALQTLEAYLGEDLVHLSLAEFFRRWRFAHPTTRDLIDVFEEVAGENLSWFFAPVFFGTGALDYAITELAHESLPGPDGLIRSTVTAERLGEVALPTEIEVRFADGEVAMEPWEGQPRTLRLEYLGAYPVVAARVDPTGNLLLDVNRLNNGRRTGGGGRILLKLAGRWLFWMENLLMLIGFLG